MGSIIWEAFKPDTEPERATRQDEIKARRDEVLALIRESRRAQGPRAQGAEDAPSDFVEEQGGIY